MMSDLKLSPLAMRNIFAQSRISLLGEMSVCRRCLGWVVALLLLVAWASPAVAYDDLFPMRLLSVMSSDDSGLPIGLPVSVYYDGASSETYVISSSGRITIYDEKFFPVASFGKGRGLFYPRSLVVDGKGNVYVCQGRQGMEVSPRITVYNQAFFPIKEIVFSEIPGLESYIPNRIALNRAGEMYLVGTMGDLPLGALVLDSDGRFSRWLRPRDHVYREVTPVVKVEGDADNEDLPAPLRAILYPASQWGVQTDPELQPVILSDLDIDKNGQIYLVSREVSHIYVFDAGEKFLSQFGQKGGAEGKLSQPVGIVVDYDRRIVAVCDYMRHTIVFYDYDTGRYIYEAGGRGAAPLWFNFPNDIEITKQGYLVVSDLFNRRVQAINVKMMEERFVPVINPVILGTPVTGAPDAIAMPAVGRVGMVPDLSVHLAGMTGAPVGPGPGLHMQGVPVLPPREISPALTKKQLPAPVNIAMPVEPAQVQDEALAIPGKMTLAAATFEAAASVAENDGPSGPGERLNSMPVAVMVYGPVVALVGLGSWLLQRRQ